MAGEVGQAIGTLRDLAKPDDIKKDSYDMLVQQAFANDPDMLNRLNDPRVKAILKGAMGDAFIKGNEKILQEVLPGIVDKINTAQIDLNKADAQKKIDAESQKAQSLYQAWVAQRQSQYKVDETRASTTLDINTIGLKAYENAVAGFSAFSRFFIAIVDCCQEGSLDPLRAMVAESSKPKDFGVKTTGVSSVGNAPANPYTMQAPQMPGANSPADLSRAQNSPNPLGELTMAQQQAAAQQQSPEVQNGTASRTATFRDNAAVVTTPRTTAPAARKSVVPPITFGGPAPKPR